MSVFAARLDGGEEPEQRRVELGSGIATSVLGQKEVRAVDRAAATSAGAIVVKKESAPGDLVCDAQRVCASHGALGR